VSEWLVEVYAASLVARRSHFPSEGGSLYVPGEDLQGEMHRRGMLPRSAEVLTEKVRLDRIEPEGRSKVGDNWRDRMNGVRFSLRVRSDRAPTKAEMRPWELKRVTELEVPS
jgi:hypothetical protein